MADLQNTRINSDQAITLAAGSTAERPSNPAVGMLRFNTSDVVVEFYNGTEWLPITAAGGPTPVSFYESRDGSNMGEIWVYVVDTNGNILSTLYNVSGDRGNNSWFFIDLGDVNPGQTFRIAWRHLSGGSFRADYAVDNIEIGDSLYTFESGNEDFLTTSGINTTSSTQALSNAIPVPTTTSATTGQWNRDSGGTGSSSTGPSSGFNSTFYLYTETSSGNDDTNFWLFSPEI